jgi:hypothetical protein
MQHTIEVPDKCFPHLVVVYIKLDPDRHEHLRLVRFLCVGPPGSVNRMQSLSMEIN